MQKMKFLGNVLTPERISPKWTQLDGFRNKSNAESNKTSKTIDWIRTNVLKLYAGPWNRKDAVLPSPKERQRLLSY